MLRLLVVRRAAGAAKPFPSTITAFLTRNACRLAFLHASLNPPRFGQACASPSQPSRALIRHYAASPRRRTTATKTTRRTTKVKSSTKPKATKAKKKPKPKPKPKRKPAKKEPELTLMRRKVRALKAQALLSSKPKQLPSSSYTVFAVSQAQKGVVAIASSKDAANRWKQMSTSEKEHYQNIAQENRKANAKTQETWIKTIPADDVRKANNARRQLNKIAREPKPQGAKYALVPHKVTLLKDSRQPKRPVTAYFCFLRDRYSSSYSDMPVVDAGKRIAAEWKNLSAAERQKYIAESENERSRFQQEWDAMKRT